MVNDKRTHNDLPSIDEMRAQLNEAQRLTLAELELLGWSLKFVRMPLFQEPVPVVVSKGSDQIGLLDAEGKILIDKDRIRDGSSHEPAAAPEPATPEVDETTNETVAGTSEVAVDPNFVDKRKGETPVPENLEDYLNEQQINALRQIENFGWVLKFVRRPLFQEPVAVIINDDGDRVGTLEADGRIDLQQNFSMREEAQAEKHRTVESAEPDVTKKLVS